MPAYSLLVGSTILKLRHLFYDKGWAKSFSTDTPSVCIGNLSVGGSGKTPMAELLIRTFLESSGKGESVVKVEDYDIGGLFAGIELFDGIDFGGHDHKGKIDKPLRIAVLSRGYKRKTKEFLIVEADGTARDFGDEPLQIKRKFPDITVAVDADRVRGAGLLADRADVIILDDAYQHRRIRADLNILLTPFSKPYFDDHLIPMGSLRDLSSRAVDADVIVVTKCPTCLDDDTRNAYIEKMGVSSFDPRTCEGTSKAGRKQTVLFSTMIYDPLVPVFEDKADLRYLHAQRAVLFTGIANDVPLQKHLCEAYAMVDHIKFPDHHYFTDGDISKIASSARRYGTSILVTTEKDTQRLRDCIVLPPEICNRLFYCPVRTMMLTPVEQNVLREKILKVTGNF